MARDYKKRTASRKTKRKSGASPWRFMLTGFALGIVVAMIAYRVFAPPAPAQPSAPVPTATAEPQSAVEPPPEAPAGRKSKREKDERFTFYDILPNFEVVIPESEERVAGLRSPTPVSTPGAYVLQAGSFKNFSDADRMKATLALQGIEAQIQKVTIDDQTWHRVRVGPITELGEVNELRTRLRMANINALLLRVAQ